MDRTVKNPPAAKLRPGQDVFLLPGSLEAEPWEVWISGAGGESKCAQVCAAPRDNPWRKRSTLVLPVDQVFCLPLWLNESDPGRLAGMIGLQLEARGLADAIHQWSVVDREEGRTLVLAGVLPATLSAELQVEAYRTFDVSARYLPWPENTLTLWREQGRLAAAFTRGSQLVYFQTLGEERCTERAVQTLICLRASLEMQSVLKNLSQITAWTELGPSELAALQSGLKLPVRQEEEPLPVPPAAAWNLCPPEVSRSKKQDQTRRWKSRALLLFLAAYLLFAAFLLIQFYLTSRQVAGLRQWRAGHAADLAEIERARSDWQRLQPVVDTNAYPLEVLLHCAAAIPKDQLRLTFFELNDGKAVLKGEANNIAAAYSFFDRLKNAPELASFTWRMGEPHLLPNDLAQLQIEGTHAAANP